MGREPVAPDWPELSADEVERVLARYPGQGHLLSLGWHSPRPFSAASLVETSTGRLFVKRHHSAVRTATTLGEEHRFIDHLARRGAPVAAILRTTEGLSAVSEGGWVFEVHRTAPGEDLYRDALSWTPFLSPEHAWAAGRALAELHRAAEGFTAAPRSTPVLVANFRLFGAANPVAAIEASFAHRPALAEALADRDWRREIGETLLPFHARLRPRLAAQTALWTHGDWHASNLLWSGNEVRSVLDFGLADRNFALFDLATAIERNGIGWLDLDEGRDAEVQYEQIAALLAAYASLRPFEAETLAALLPLVHADFALSEVEYFHGIVGSPENTSVAYQRYLLGHTQWFSEGSGRLLLERIAGRNTGNSR
ncbi:phosphotransferase enzyme family protein [Niveibacterium terrae]|uniref:phosphotransferase enzyme family protein n=1 Tax=Niveibacterium terrae TaxID=3373598 RepID=UPI003A92ECC1